MGYCMAEGYKLSEFGPPECSRRWYVTDPVPCDIRSSAHPNAIMLEDVTDKTVQRCYSAWTSDDPPVQANR